MHEIARAGSKKKAKWNAALKMINRLHAMAPKPLMEMQNIPQQYQGQGQPPSFCMDGGLGNAVQHQYQRGLNFPGRNGGTNAMMRPSNINADPYANAGGYTGGYAHGNAHERRSYEQNQINNHSHQLDHRRPLYRSYVTPIKRKSTFSVPEVRAALESSLSAPPNIDVATLNSDASDTAMKTRTGDKMAISISPTATQKKKKEGLQLEETAAKTAPVQRAVPIKKSLRGENVLLKARNVPRKNPKFLRPQVAPKVNNIDVSIKRTKESSMCSAPLKIKASNNTKNVPSKDVESFRKQTAALEGNRIITSMRDNNMKDVEDSRGTVNLTATDGSCAKTTNALHEGEQ